MKKFLVLGILSFLLFACSEVTENDISIDDFKINESGDLFFRNENLGRIVGQNGKDGIDGKDGINGKDGIDGIDGINGRDGVDGKDAIDINPFYMDLSSFKINDELPINAGIIPFTWTIDDNTTVFIESVAFKLHSKISIEEAKKNPEFRLFGTYYPYFIEAKIRGRVSNRYGDHIVIIFGDNYRGIALYGSSNADGTFEFSEIFGTKYYSVLTLSNIYFE